MSPKVHPSCYIHPSAHIIGDVTLEKDVNVWIGAVLRGDLTTIYVKEKTNIQDYCVLHVDPHFPIILGKGCVLGHGCMVHGATIGDECLIGIHAVIMNGAEIGSGTIIGANAVVPRDMKIPEASLVLGTPAKIVRSDDQELVEQVRDNRALYEKLIKEYKAGKHPEYVPEDHP
jgi:carbonic anhydrase/acetyltransferase-like protein (isoleucine patch superfamily)